MIAKRWWFTRDLHRIPKTGLNEIGSGCDLFINLLIWDGCAYSKWDSTEIIGIHRWWIAKWLIFATDEVSTIRLVNWLASKRQSIHSHGIFCSSYFCISLLTQTWMMGRIVTQIATKSLHLQVFTPVFFFLPSLFLSNPCAFFQRLLLPTTSPVAGSYGRKLWPVPHCSDLREGPGLWWRSNLRECLGMD